MNKTRYSKAGNYRFQFASGGTEAVRYDGKTKSGMHRFVFADGQVWTGYDAPVVVE